MDSVFLVYILSGFVGLLLIWILILEFRLRKFFRGKSGKNLESVIAELIKELDLFSAKTSGLEDNLKKIETRVKKSIQYVGVVRFNPFGDVGGDQSFALALLNEEKNGAVLSSFYGREMNRIYVKPIQSGDSRHKLSKEEKEAIK